MNKIKTYFANQADRGASMLFYDFVMIGGFAACVYFGWIH